MHFFSASLVWIEAEIKAGFSQSKGLTGRIQPRAYSCLSGLHVKTVFILSWFHSATQHGNVVMILLLGNEIQHYSFSTDTLPPFFFFFPAVLHTWEAIKQDNSFKNEWLFKDASQYPGTELQDPVSYHPSFHIRVFSSACGPRAVPCNALSQHRTQPSETPDPNVPHSSLARVIITETHLHLYFPPFVSNQMPTGNNWSDMNLVRGWCLIRNPIKLSSSPNRPSTERKHLVMAWRTPVYIVSSAGNFNGFRNQKLDFTLES